MKKRLFILSITLCFVLSLVLVNKLSNSYSTAVSQNIKVPYKPTIVIDCGHGGEDGGAVSNDGILEKDINLEIGLILEDLFLQGGFNVKMIRRTDTAIYSDNAKTLREKKISDIHNRSDICNSNDNNVYISLHQNKFTDSKYYGTQVFYSQNTPESKELAEYIRLAVRGLIQNNNERQCKAATNSIYILDKAQVPAVLIECGFLSNIEETEKLKSDNYRKQLAFSIYAGFLEYYYNINNV